MTNRIRYLGYKKLAGARGVHAAIGFVSWVY